MYSKFSMRRLKNAALVLILFVFVIGVGGHDVKTRGQRRLNAAPLLPSDGVPPTLTSSEDSDVGPKVGVPIQPSMGAMTAVRPGSPPALADEVSPDRNRDASEGVDTDNLSPADQEIPWGPCLTNNGGCGDKICHAKTHADQICYAKPDTTSWIECSPKQVRIGQSVRCSLTPKRINEIITTYGSQFEITTTGPLTLVERPAGPNTEFKLQLVANGTTTGEARITMALSDSQRPVTEEIVLILDAVDPGSPAPKNSCDVENGGCGPTLTCAASPEGIPTCFAKPDATSWVECNLASIRPGGSVTCTITAKRKDAPLDTVSSLIKLEVETDGPLLPPASVNVIGNKWDVSIGSNLSASGVGKINLVLADNAKEPITTVQIEILDLVDPYSAAPTNNCTNANGGCGQSLVCAINGTLAICLPKPDETSWLECAPKILRPGFSSKCSLTAKRKGAVVTTVGNMFRVVAGAGGPFTSMETPSGLGSQWELTAETAATPMSAVGRINLYLAGKPTVAITEEIIELSDPVAAGEPAPTGACTKENGGCGANMLCVDNSTMVKRANRTVSLQDGMDVCLSKADSSSWIECFPKKVRPGEKTLCNLIAKRKDETIMTIGSQFLVTVPTGGSLAFVQSPQGINTTWDLEATGSTFKRGIGKVQLYIKAPNKLVTEFSVRVTDLIESGDKAPGGDCAVDNGGCGPHFVCAPDPEADIPTCYLKPDHTTWMGCEPKNLTLNGQARCVFIAKRYGKIIMTKPSQFIVKLAEIGPLAHLEWVDGNKTADTWEVIVTASTTLLGEGAVLLGLSETRDLIAEEFIVVQAEIPVLPGDHPPSRSCDFNNGGCGPDMLCVNITARENATFYGPTCLVKPDRTSWIECNPKIFAIGGGTTECVITPKRDNVPIRTVGSQFDVQIEGATLLSMEWVDVQSHDRESWLIRITGHDRMYGSGTVRLYLAAESGQPTAEDIIAIAAVRREGVKQCQEPTCTDGVRNGGESDVDCGRACYPSLCGYKYGCNGDADCGGGYCVDSLFVSPKGRDTIYKQCSANHCYNNIFDGESESGADCGGDCIAKCRGGEFCKTGDDCLSRRCLQGGCAEHSCRDGVLNGYESDMDCGGHMCPKCAAGKFCVVPRDCESGICWGSGMGSVKRCYPADCTDDSGQQRCDQGSRCPPCIPSTCSNKLLDPNEIDVDCGPVCDRPCAAWYRCEQDDECDSYICRFS